MNSKNKQMGITCYVYRWSRGDCTLNGVTSKDDTVFLRMDNGYTAGSDAVSNGYPILKLVKKVYAGQEYMYAVPVKDENKQTFFGGNFIYCNDSRFPNNYPIKVHDRVEG